MSIRSTTNGRRRSRWSIESVAGWVFADLFLVLFLVGLGSAVTMKPTAAPKPPPTVPVKPKPTVKPTPPIIGLKKDPELRTIAVDPDALTSSGPSGTREGGVVCRRIRQQVAALSGKQAGLVLIFGGGSDVVHGQSLARGVAKQLTCASPALFPRTTLSRPFWDGTLGSNQVRLEIFVFTTKKTS